LLNPINYSQILLISLDACVIPTASLINSFSQAAYGNTVPVLGNSRICMNGSKKWMHICCTMDQEPELLCPWSPQRDIWELPEPYHRSLITFH